MGYELSSQYVERYADLLVNYALGGGQGISTNDIVLVIAPESAKPLYAELCRAIWRAGGGVIGHYQPDDDATTNLSRDFYALASDEQITFFMERYQRGLVDQSDHMIYIDSVADPHAMQSVDPVKLMAHQASLRPLVEWHDAKENAGAFTWTIALYGTEAMAREAGLSLEEYWAQIIAACFLDDADPKASWRAAAARIRATIDALDALAIERLHVRGPDADLRLTVGEQRRWIGGGGRNIPSFEIFTSPDWRGTEGWIRFNQPLYIHGTLITGVELHFENGLVTRATATENEALLTEMLAVPNADRVGEFSLTDARLSRITKFMATTLYDENVGGPFGNTHVAVGKALQICHSGDTAAMTADDWEHLGFNESSVHTDIVSTTDREVTATLADGTTRTIYADGRFQVGD